MNSVISSLIITALGAAEATLFTLGLRSDWYVQRTAENVLRANRRPVTPDATAQIVPWLKIGLIIGIVMGVAITIIGVTTLMIGVAKVLEGR